MVFVELTPFVAFRTAHWTDEDLRSLQNFLLAAPDAGDVIRGGSGLRKLRWSAQGRGKRGGARVIFYRYVPGGRSDLLDLRLLEERTGRFDARPDQGDGRTYERCRKWISNILIS